MLQIEEKKASREVFVEVSDQPISKELSWCGCGAPISFEVAQAMRSILLGGYLPQGMLTRTRRLVENARQPYAQDKDGLYVYRLKSGAYAYKTFLGTVGNFILYTQIKHQLSAKIEGLFVRFDELGIESNEWIPFETLALPFTELLFQ